MPLTVTVEGSTYLRRLPYTRLSKLARLLDPLNDVFLDWRGLASRITQRPGDDQPRYGSQEIAIFNLEYKRAGGSPTVALITDWGTTNATVSDLIDALIDMKHFAAAEVILPGSTADNAMNNLSPAMIGQGNYESGLGEKLENPHPHSKKPDDSLDSSTDAAQHCSETQEWDVTSSVPEESSDLPDFEPNEVKEYSYRLLSNMTDSFNDVPLSEGGNMVGEGGFGTVYLGRFSDNHECAVKRLTQFQDYDMSKQYQNELQALKRLQHPNLVQLYGFSFDGPSLCLIFHYLHNGSLQSALSSQSTLDLSWEARVHVAQGTAQGLCYLHSEGTVHRDVKSANILLDKDLTAKVADFGLVRALPGSSNKTQITSLIIGTNIYMSPEARNGEISPKHDCFSYGVVLLELLTGLEPLDNEREDRDIISYVEVALDKHEDVLMLVDQRLRSSSYTKAAVEKMFYMAMDCLKRKQKRPLLTDILPSVMELSDTQE